MVNNNMLIATLIIRSTITRTVIKHVLIKGFCIAALGIACLLIGGIFLGPSHLQKWGWLLFLLSIGMITLGLLPYRRIVRLQLKPNEITLVDADQLIFFSRGRKKLTIPIPSIAKMEYIDHPVRYGIAVFLNKPPPRPLSVHESPQEVEKMRYEGQKKGEADLFFPYFNRHAYEELIDWISDNPIS